jgi:hypothetical protein
MPSAQVGETGVSMAQSRSLSEFSGLFGMDASMRVRIIGGVVHVVSCGGPVVRAKALLALSASFDARRLRIFADRIVTETRNRQPVNRNAVHPRPIELVAKWARMANGQNQVMVATALRAVSIGGDGTMRSWGTSAATSLARFCPGSAESKLPGASLRGSGYFQ